MYYRVAIQVNLSPHWQWKSTLLGSLDAVFRWLRLYRPLPQDRLRVFSSSSRPEMGDQFMRTNYFLPVLLLLLGSLLLSACDVVGASASSSLGAITPRDTSVRTLMVTIGITEDQDATDGRSTISLQFRTDAVEEDNSVRFAHREAVSCNGVTLKLNDAPTYTLSVPQGGYTCSYTGYTQGIGQLAPVTLIDVAARSRLSPHPPSVSSTGYAIGYTADSRERACPLTADAADGVNDVIPGVAASSDLGVYDGPATSSLTGPGTIRLQRTCSWILHDPFDTVSLTYQSTANVTVTWSH
jgi:hypothetical protein